MARKEKHEEHVNHERWLVSYADFITLLFAFFVVMYAVSEIDKAKMKKTKKSFRNFGVQNSVKDPSSISAFAIFKSGSNNIGGGMYKRPDQPTIDNESNDSKKKQKDEHDWLKKELASDPSKWAERLGLRLRRRLKDTTNPRVTPYTISLKDDGLHIAIPAQALFDAGETTLKDDARTILDDLALEISALDRSVRIDGHESTASTLAAKKFADGWEMTILRATRIARYFAGRYVLSDRIHASGFGTNHPVAPQDRNRGIASERYEIVILTDERDRN